MIVRFKIPSEFSLHILDTLYCCWFQTCKPLALCIGHAIEDYCLSHDWRTMDTTTQFQLQWVRVSKKGKLTTFEEARDWWVDRTDQDK